MFQIAVTFSLREGEENAMKGGVNGFRREHGNKCAKPMKVVLRVAYKKTPRDFCH